MFNRLKNLKVNYYLLSLISLEAFYIAQVYYPLYGTQGVIASAIYTLIAFAHIRYPSKQLANLILVISLAIAIPRILVMVETRIDERRMSTIATIDEQLSGLEKPIGQNFQDCKLIPPWEGVKIANCQTANNDLQIAFNEAMANYSRNKNELLQAKEQAKEQYKLTLADYGSLIMFCVLSIALPSVIYFILLQNSPEVFIPEIQADRLTMDESIVSEALRLYKQGVKVEDITKQLSISRSTIYKYIKKSVTHEK